MSGQSGYNPAYFALIASSERTHFWFRARNRVLRTVLMANRARLPADARVLEIGTGTGATLRVLEEVFPSARVFGMDLYAEALHYAREQSRAALLQGRVEAHPFGTRFDLIGLFDVLEHIERDDLALQAIRELLAPGGVLVRAGPAGAHLWSAFDVEAHHCRRYSRCGIENRLRSAGFDIIYLTPFMTAIYPLVWLSRRLRPTRSAANSAAAELQPPGWLNALADIGLRPERWVLRAGRHLPFGTSLLAVATPRRGAVAA